MSDHTAFMAQLPSHLPVARENDQWIIALNTTQDLQSVMALANDTRTPLLPQGLWDKVPRQKIWLDCSRLNRVKSYRNEELLITVETGMTVGQLEETLDAQDQRMALIYSKSRTVMSILGEEPLSLSQTRYGPLRQWVTGVEAFTGDAEYIHYGGEVVKNVTGYDLNKLFIGSRHRYGLLTSAILKVEAKPEMSRSFLFHVEDLQQALALLHKLIWMLPNPEMLSLFRTKTTFGWQLLVTLSGYRDLVNQESDAIHQVISHLNADLQELYLAPKALEQWVQKLDWLHPQEPDALVLRIALGHKQMLELPYRFFSLPWLKTADLLMPMGTSQLMLRWISVNIPGTEQLEELKTKIEEMDGFVEILRLPPHTELDETRFNADPQPTIAQWETRLKAQFDPRHILPGSLLTPLQRSQEAVR